MAFQKINIEELRLGMYVKLDCGWWRHPFAHNQFKVTSEKDLSTIRNISKLTLYYDHDLSDPEAPGEIPIEDTPSSSTVSESSPTEEPPAFLETKESSLEEMEPSLQPTKMVHQELGNSRGGDRRQRVEANRARREQLNACEHAHNEALQQSKLALRKLSRGADGGVDMANRVLSKAEEMLHHDHTIGVFIELMNAGDPDDYHSFHALNVSILSMMVGKELGLSPEEVRDVGLGALLHDIGMIHMPQASSLPVQASTSDSCAQEDSEGHIILNKGKELSRALRLFLRQVETSLCNIMNDSMVRDTPMG